MKRNFGGFTFNNENDLSAVDLAHAAFFKTQKNAWAKDRVYC